MPVFSDIFMLIIFIPSIMLMLAIYLFQAISIYTLSKRCGLAKPYLAFIPIANYYQIGLLADQYERPVKIGKLRYALTILATLQGIVSVFFSFYMIKFTSDLFSILPSFDTLSNSEMDIFWQAYMKFFFFFFIYFIFALPSMILMYVALYKIYKMTNPSNAVLFLILSIFVSGSSVVILFISRNKPLIFPNEQQTWQPYNQ